MKKMKSKFLMVCFAIFAFVISLTTYSLAFSLNGTDMSYNADLASYAENHPDDFIDADYTKFLNKKVYAGGGNRHGRQSDIDFRTSGCLYHREGDIAGTRNKIVGVIDIDGVNTKVNGKRVEFSSNIATRRKQEFAISKMGYAIWNAQNARVLDKENVQKNAIRYVWFRDDFCWLLKKYADIPRSFYTNSVNGVLTSGSVHGESYKDEIKKVQSNKYYKLQKTDSGNQSLKKDKNGNQYLGPFKIKYSGYDDVSNLTLTVDGVSYDISEYYTKSSSTYTQHTGDVVKNKSFYIKLQNTININDGNEHTWSLQLKTGTKKVYKARILLISNPNATGQNLLIWAAQKDRTKDKVKWNGNFSDSGTPKDCELKIMKVDDSGDDTPLPGVGFTITAEIKVWKFKEHQTAYKACTHYHSGYYQHDNDGYYDRAQTRPIPCSHYVSSWYDHPNNTCPWTKNVYEQVTKTMYLTSNGTWSDSSTILYTDSNGLIDVSNIVLPDAIEATNVESDGDKKELKAEYANDNVTATEVENNYYGYEYKTETSFKSYVLERNSSEVQVIENHQKYVKLSGYVWLDGGFGKETLRNDQYDVEEQPGVNNIPVYLVDKSGNVIKQTTTGTYDGYSEISGGQYQFTDVDLDEIKNGSYHVEFKYNGFYYSAVDSNLSENNTSKAEDTNTRDILNGKFTSVDGNGTQSLNVNGVTIDYGYINSHQSSIVNASNADVIASTDETGYNLYNGYDDETKEIRYVNFGMYEKEQTDYALTKDLYDVKVVVNNRSHIYRYANKRYNQDGTEKDSWGDMTVKFQNDNGTYSRAIYKSDANFEQTDDSKNLKVYATYKIALRNESVYLGRINSIVDYCDNRFNLINAGTEIGDNTDEISGDILQYSQKMGYDNKYSGYIVNANMLVYPETTSYLYLQFEVTNYNDIGNNWRMTLASGSDIDLNNVAEIYSYTTFKDYDTSSYLAVADNDSVPGNAIPGNIDTYEDDTDAARTFKLELGEQRSIEGNVFVDGTSSEKQVAKVRLGDGIFNNGETTVKGVKVELYDTETDSPAQIFNEQYGIFENAILDATGDDGHFEFSGYVPGNYVIKYTWGDSTYTVQYYKGTIYEKDRVNKYGEPTKNEFWYRGLVEGKFYDDTISPDVRATDAWDDKNTRIRIDQQMADLKYNTIEDEIKKAYTTTGSDYIKDTKMTSTTPNMEMSVECITDVTDSRDDEGTFDINNIDFGIVERARQELNLNKRVSGYKITLANGQVLVNTKVNEDGSLSETNPYTIWLAPQIDENGKLISNGLIKTEMDNEIIEGATLEIEYTMKVENVGELDYTTWDYYYYGRVPDDDSELVTISVEELLDYVDGRLPVVDNKWNLVGQDYLQKVNASQQNIKNELKTYITEKVKEPMTPKEPNNIRTVTLQTSKLLTSTDDNEFNNVAEITTVGKPEEPDIPKGTPVKVSGDSDGIRHFNKWDSQTITIIPSTGENRDYGTPIIVAIIIITVSGIGIIIIKKFIIDK